MNINEMWEQASRNPGTEIKLGKLVVCDACGEDYTDNAAPGGFIFGSYAYCPECAASQSERIKEYGEEHFIRARCPENQSFADFVRDYRGEEAAICIEGF